MFFQTFLLLQIHFLFNDIFKIITHQCKI